MKKDKNTLVLLHGFCENAELWNSFIPLLNAKQQVVTLDLAGFGSNQLEVTSIDEMADDVIQQMYLLELSSVCIVGHSLGGYVAVKVAKKNPERIKGLGFFHSNALSDSPEKKLQRAKSAKHLEEYGAEAFLKTMSVSLLGASNTTDFKLVEEVLRHINNAPQKGIIAAMHAMSERSDELEFLSKTTMKVLWIIGRQDTFMEVASQLQQASLCHKTMIHILENAGHLGMWETPEESAGVVNQFTDWIFS